MLRRWTAALACVALLEVPVVTAQTSALPTPLSYEAAVEYALAHNLMVDAARRGRAVREANVSAAGQRPNPDFAFNRLVEIVYHGNATREEIARMATMSGLASQWRDHARQLLG